MAAFCIFIGMSIIIGCFLKPPNEVEVTIFFPLSLYAEFRGGRAVVRGTDTDAWIVGLPLGAAFIFIGFYLLRSSSVLI